MEEGRPESLPPEWAAWEVSPWEALRGQTLRVVILLEELRAPLLAFGMDGEVVLVRAWPSRMDLRAHSRWPGMPHLEPEEVLWELLDCLERRYRDAQLVELFAQWPDPAGEAFGRLASHLSQVRQDAFP